MESLKFLGNKFPLPKSPKKLIYSKNSQKSIKYILRQNKK